MGLLNAIFQTVHCQFEKLLYFCIGYAFPRIVEGYHFNRSRAKKGVTCMYYSYATVYKEARLHWKKV